MKNIPDEWNSLAKKKLKKRHLKKNIKKAHGVETNNLITIHN